MSWTQRFAPEIKNLIEARDSLDAANEELETARREYLTALQTGEAKNEYRRFEVACEIAGLLSTHKNKQVAALLKEIHNTRSDVVND